MLITRACNASMPKKRLHSTRKSSYWWNEEIADARRLHLAAWSTLSRARRESLDPDHIRDLAEFARQAKTHLNREICCSKRLSWAKLCREADTDIWGLAYRILFSKLRRRSHTPGLNNSNILQIVRNLFPHGPPPGFPPLISGEHIPPISPQELKFALGSQGAGAPGPDAVPGAIIRYVAINHPNTITRVFDHCFSISSFPTRWKKAILCSNCEYNLRLSKSVKTCVSCGKLTTTEMLRRQARLQREYLYRKGVEDRQKNFQDKKNRLKRSLNENVPIPGYLRKKAMDLQDKLEYEDSGPKAAARTGGESGGGALANSRDDEYRFAGVEDPKIMITTSRDPSSQLKMFVKEVRLIFPNAQRMNRGNTEIKELVEACRSVNVTDLIILHEHRGEPNQLVVCHLPYGPTAYFTMLDVMRHDIPNLGTVSEQYPHLIFHNLKSRLGERVESILKHLFPVPKEDSKPVISFSNHDDYVAFRQHTYRKVGGQVELSEVGPRFQLRLHKIMLGTLDTIEAADTEWCLRPYMNTHYKRRFLSDDDGFVEQ